MESLAFQQTLSNHALKQIGEDRNRQGAVIGPMISGIIVVASTGVGLRKIRKFPGKRKCLSYRCQLSYGSLLLVHFEETNRATASNRTGSQIAKYLQHFLLCMLIQARKLVDRECILLEQFLQGNWIDLHADSG